MARDKLPSTKAWDGHTTWDWRSAARGRGKPLALSRRDRKLERERQAAKHFGRVDLYAERHEGE